MELDGFDFSESVYQDNCELQQIFNDYSSHESRVGVVINDWLRHMPRW